MLVRVAMIPNPLVVGPDTTLLEFIDRVLDSNQTTAAVVDRDRLAGVVSVHDIFRVILPAYLDKEARLADALREGFFDEKFAEFAQTHVDSVMSTKVDTVAPDESIMKVVRLFVRKQRKMVPVIEDGRWIGNVTRRSVLRRVAHAAGPTTTTPTPPVPPA